METQTYWQQLQGSRGNKILFWLLTVALVVTAVYVATGADQPVDQLSATYTLLTVVGAQVVNCGMTALSKEKRRRRT